MIIPNYNGEKHLAECLDALDKQSYKDFETVVVDNGSNDKSIQVITTSFPHVKLIKLENNHGFAGGVNAGIRATQSKHVVLLNNDAIPDADWLEELVKAARHGDIVASKILFFSDRKKLDSTGEFISKWGLAYPRDRGKTDNGKYANYPEIFAASGGACLIKREVLNTIGLFDETFFAYCEDVDLGFRARLAGYKIVFAQDSFVYHHVGATSSKMGDFARYHYIKNTQLLFYKNMPLPILIMTLPRFMFVQTLLIAGALKNNAGITALKAHMRLISLAPHVLRERRRIQKSKKVAAQAIRQQLTDQWPLGTSLRNPLRAIFAK